MITLKTKKLHENAVIPFFAKPGDSGFDLVVTETTYISPGDYAKVPIGLAFEVPPGYELQIRPRSGITSKSGLRVQLGTVDSGYRGEVMVMVDNHEDTTQMIVPGTRIAQGVINKLPPVQIQEVDELGASERGTGGFGSTGVKSKTDKTEEYIRISTEGKL